MAKFSVVILVAVLLIGTFGFLAILNLPTYISETIRNLLFIGDIAFMFIGAIYIAFTFDKR